MIMTTPNEFLQFANDMGLGKVSTNSDLISTNDNNNNYTRTGLVVLNNLCRLIEQIHELKTENKRLRSHLELFNHVEKFHQRYLSKTTNEQNNPKKVFQHEQKQSSTFSYDEDKSDTLSPTNSLKIKRTLSNREHKSNNPDESSSVLPLDHEQSEINDNNLTSSSVATWNKVRHALRFTLRRKHDSPASPPLSHCERQIPTISVSIESDDDQLQDNKYLKQKKKKNLPVNDHRQNPIGEDTDQEDETIQFIRDYQKRTTQNFSINDRQETSSAINLTSNPDDDPSLTRKPSKIARYRRKLRSKLDNVKKQFSDQNSSSSIRLFHNSHGSTFDDIGSGLNHALLSAQLAPAFTKSYQQKMREWETMQKSHFLVNYRRQSLTPKIDLNNNSRKTSLSQVPNEPSLGLANNPSISSTNVNYSSTIDQLNHDIETNISTLGPILSSNQRSLIVHQWREIMSEEISLRYYNEYLENKILLLKQLEANLKSLKTKIFCTNYLNKQQSMINLNDDNDNNDQYKSSYMLQRSRSLQSFVSMPASWILAVQSAAYSDVLDGTSNKTTEKAILFNKDFFDRLQQFKHDRLKFEQDFIRDSKLINRKKKSIPKTQLHIERIPLRGCLRKLSLISSSEFPQHFTSDPIIPLQTIIPNIPSTSTNNEILCLSPLTAATTINNHDLSLLSSSIHQNKQTKRSRFDLKKTFQRSRSMCMTQFHSWLQRRRQPYSSAERRKSAAESKVPLTPCSTPKLLGSPRLARLHQKIFRHSPSSSPPAPRSVSTTRTHIPIQILDDSDNRSQYELPVRIYFPAAASPPTTRHVRINEMSIITTTTTNEQQDIQIESTSNMTTPIMNRKYTTSSLQMTTAKERRESFATLSNVFNNKCL